MQKYLLDYLACPICHADLTVAIGNESGHRIIEADFHCQHCEETFPVHNGIANFLTDKKFRNDNWSQVESGLSKYLNENPALKQRLMADSLETLNPADKFFRGMILEENGYFAESQPVMNAAMQGLYTADYLSGQKNQREFVVAALKNVDTPIVDIASGRGYLVEAMLREGLTKVVATDFSPTVLERNRKYFTAEGLYQHLSLIACDAKLMPFKDDSIPNLTSFVGLSNIQDAGKLLQELKRINSQMFRAICEFYPDTTDSNSEAIHKYQLENFLFKDNAIQNFELTDWSVTIQNRHVVSIAPTPESDILGFGIDGLPVESTEIVSCTLVATT